MASSLRTTALETLEVKDILCYESNEIGFPRQMENKGFDVEKQESYELQDSPRKENSPAINEVMHRSFAYFNLIIVGFAGKAIIQK